jgi:uncharacterized protein YggU (UPF0235/DUF167 family)
MWYTILENQVSLHIIAKPNAKKTALVAVTDETLHISLQAKPHQGKANQALIAYLAELLNLPKSQIKLQKGDTHRYKKVLVPLTEGVRAFLAAQGVI